MKLFIKHNRQFGRKIICKTKNIISGRVDEPITFNDKHLNFNDIKCITKYNTSHLELVEEHNVMSDDSDSESEDSL